jgi:hypothetical protein
MFIPLILVYSQVFIPINGNQINEQLTIIPKYYINLQNIYNQMIDSCVNYANNVNKDIKNDCNNKILIFLNKVSNNTIDFSTSIEEISNMILTIILNYPNDYMRKKNILQYLYNFSKTAYLECSHLNTRRLREDSNCSTFLGNTLCRLIHFFWGGDSSDCD